MARSNGGDGLDALMQELSTKEAGERRIQDIPADQQVSPPRRTTAADGWGEEVDDVTEDGEWDDWGEEAGDHDNGGVRRAQEPRASQERVQYYQKQIKDYITDLADPFVLQEVDKRLRARSYESVGEYYVSRPKLAEYTIESELHRMTYTVGYHNAVLATKPDDVRRVYGEHSDALIWRFANQSIFADCLQELQGRFLRSDLCIGVVSRDSSFRLDLADDAMTATSLFAIMIAASPTTGEGVGSSSAVELATIKGSVSVSVSQEKLCQSVELGALRIIFDDTINAVAAALAEDEARQGSPHPDEAHEGFYGYKPGFVPLASTSAAALSAVRDQIIVSAASLRTASLAGGLLERGRLVVSNLGTMIEEAASAANNEQGGSGDTPSGQEGSDGARGKEMWSGSELLGAKGAAMVAAKGEGVLEGIVGSIGSLVRADSEGDSQGNASAFPGASSGVRLYRSEEDERVEEVERKRREAAARLEAAARSLGPASSTPAWPSSSACATEAATSSTTATSTADEQKGGSGGSLPPPPSARLKGLLTGLGGFIASTVERVVSEERGQQEATGEGLRLYRREGQEVKQTSADQGGPSPAAAGGLFR